MRELRKHLPRLRVTVMTGPSDEGHGPDSEPGSLTVRMQLNLKHRDCRRLTLSSTRTRIASRRPGVEAW